MLYFTIFDQNDEWKLKKSNPVGGGNTSLPAFLFADKKEGDILQLQYRGELIELELNQLKYMKQSGRFLPNKRAECHFEKVFKGTFQEVSNKVETCKKSEISASIFPDQEHLVTKDTWKFRFKEYTLDNGGVLYHAIIPEDKNDPNKKPYIEEADPEDFQGVEDFRRTVFIHLKKIRFIPSKDKITIRMEMPGVIDEVDLVVNEKSLYFYGKVKNTDPAGPSEYLRVINWADHFEDLSLEEMQDRIKNATVGLSFGVFTIKIPR